MDKNRVQEIITRHHHEKHSLLAVLMDLGEKGIPLDKEILQVVSDQIGLPLSRVYGLATFYKAVELEGSGLSTIHICDGIACYINGGDRLYAEVQSELEGLPHGSTSRPGYPPKKVSCLGCCAIGPNMMVGNRVFSDPNPKCLKDILRDHLNGGGHEDTGH